MEEFGKELALYSNGLLDENTFSTYFDLIVAGVELRVSGSAEAKAHVDAVDFTFRDEYIVIETHHFDVLFDRAVYAVAKARCPELDFEHIEFEEVVDIAYGTSCTDAATVTVSCN